MTRFGIEEEAMLVHPHTLHPVPVAQEVLEQLRRFPELDGLVTREYLSSQIEYSSPIFESAHDARQALTNYRQRLGSAAAAVGAIAWHGGVPFTVDGPPEVTPTVRYEELAAEYRELVREHQINAVHVHVEVASRERGVRALNAVRGWTPALLALSSNSPHWHGRDSGFESWRSIQMRRWTTHDCPPVFRDASDYEQRLQNLVGVGGTIDVGTVSWNVRLSHHHPTIEFRVFDAQLDPAQTVLLALICRALVTAVDNDDVTFPDFPPELMEASLWQAARDGLNAQLLNPVTGTLAPAHTVLDSLVTLISSAADEHGDAAEIREGIHSLAQSGTGAIRQRLAHQRSGSGGLRELHLLGAL